MNFSTNLYENEFLSVTNGKAIVEKNAAKTESRRRYSYHEYLPITAHVPIDKIAGNMQNAPDFIKEFFDIFSLVRVGKK